MLSIAIKNLCNNLSRVLFVITSLSIALATFFIFINFQSTLKNQIQESNRKKTALNQIRIFPASNTLNFSRLGQNTSNITDDIIAKIRGFSDVLSIYREITYKFPVSLETTLFGQQFFTDSLIFGLEKAVIANDLQLPEIWDDPKNEVVPLIIPTKILDLYNLSIAPNHGLPRVSSDQLIGKSINIRLNYSTGFPALDKESSGTIIGKIAGFSDSVNLSGVSIPFNKVLELNGAITNNTYSQLLITVANPKNVNALASKIESLNLQTEYLQKNLTQINAQIYYLDLTLLFLGIIISIITLSSITSTFISSIRERRKEIGILRLLGAKNRDLYKILAAEAGLIGISGSFLGIIVGIGAIFLINLALAKFSNPVIFTYFPHLEISLASATVISILGLLLSLIGSLIPAFQALRITALEVIRKG